MTGEIFINAILKKVREAKEKVQIEFSNISFQQLNWKPSLEGWSIAQCLYHLVVSDSSYFSLLKDISGGNYRMSFWAKYSPLSKLFGRIMKDQLQEDVKRRLKAPGKLLPGSSDIDPGIIDRYYKNLDNFSALISKCRNIDIDKIIITSPVVSFVTYSLKDALQFLMQHEHRHINQAIRVKTNEKFPDRSSTTSEL